MMNEKPSESIALTSGKIPKVGNWDLEKMHTEREEGLYSPNKNGPMVLWALSPYGPHHQPGEVLYKYVVP